MEKKKILILYATLGSGHKSVTNSLYDYFIKNNNYEVKTLDLVQYENIIGFLSNKLFEQNFKYRLGSFLYSIYYELFDFKIQPIPYKVMAKIVHKNKKLQQYITSFNPDLVISTFFLGSIVMGILKEKKVTNAKVISIVTDYDGHEMFTKYKEELDAIIVSNEIVKNELIAKGVDSYKIYPFGIPVSQIFNENNINKNNMQSIKEKYHVNNGKKTFLFFAGGTIGSSFSYKFLKRLLEEEYDINIIYACGKNTKVKSKAEKLIEKQNYKNVYPIGYTKKVDELLNISDVVISKPGGVSVTEFLKMKIPMILIPGNGGHERYNAKYVCKKGFGVNCKTPRKLAKTVGKLLKKKNIILNMKRKLNEIDDNKSVEKIYKLSKKLLEK